MRLMCIFLYMNRLQQIYRVIMGGQQSVRKDNLQFKHPLVALQNETNTVCYANSILQVLYHHIRFRQIILSQHANNGVLLYIKQLYSNIQNVKKKGAVLSTKKLMIYVQAKNQYLQQNHHQDSHQFFMWLVNQINDELINIIRQEKKNYNKINHPTILEKEMFLTQTTRTVCNNCRHVSQRDQLEVNLSLHIPQQNVSLSHCIKILSRKQYLRGQNKFFCDKCNSLQEAQKSTLLKSLPTFLTIHLKRFKYNNKIRGLSKINWLVSFPMQLRLSTNYYQKNTSYVYKLFGIVVHIGQGNRYGHYFSVVKIGNSWVQFNDGDIQIVDQNMIQKLFGGNGNTMCAYMLFYDRVIS